MNDPSRRITVYDEERWNEIFGSPGSYVYTREHHESRKPRRRNARSVAIDHDLPLLLVALMYGTVLMVRGVRLSLKAVWWIFRTSAIGTVYGYQVWWWILTGRGSPPVLALDGLDLCGAPAPTGHSAIAARASWSTQATDPSQLDVAGSEHDGSAQLWKHGRVNPYRRRTATYRDGTEDRPRTRSRY